MCLGGFFLFFSTFLENDGHFDSMYIQFSKLPNNNAHEISYEKAGTLRMCFVYFSSMTGAKYIPQNRG